MPDNEPSPSRALRRDRRAGATTGLVAAPPVHSARVPRAAARIRGGWFIAAGVAVAVVVAMSATMLSMGSGDVDPAASPGARDLTAISSAEECALPAVGEGGTSAHSVEACEHVGDDESDAGGPSDASPTPAPDQTDSGELPTPKASALPQEPGTQRDDATVPQRPTDSSSGPPATQAPQQPSPKPAPPPAPAPAPAPEPAPAPSALAFTGLTENHTIGLLGIRLLSSYTLSLSGEPGSSATVWYGSSRAGTVTFNASGRASITMGGALINLGLSNPVIRAAYSDGTAGSEIQARRDSI